MDSFDCLHYFRLTTTSLNNEFFGRACESWRCRLGEGEFTHDNQIKLKVEAEKERTKLDPWKVKCFVSRHLYIS